MDACLWSKCFNVMPFAFSPDTPPQSCCFCPFNSLFLHRLLLLTLYPRENIWSNNIHSVRKDEILPPAINLLEKWVWCSRLWGVLPIVVLIFSTLYTQLTWSVHVEKVSSLSPPQGGGRSVTERVTERRAEQRPVFQQSERFAVHSRSRYTFSLTTRMHCHHESNQK